MLEINAACAVQGGCFPGDAPGYPVQIGPASGASSFRLTSDLVLASGSTSTAILVEADDVTIELAGFQVISQDCLGLSSATCAAVGEGRGVDARGHEGLTVRNGSIIGMSNSAIEAGDRLRVSRVSARWNRRFGIEGGGSSSVDAVRLFDNGLGGMLVGDGSTVRRSLALDNASAGITAGSASTITSSLAARNGGSGLATGRGRISGSVAQDNGAQLFTVGVFFNSSLSPSGIADGNVSTGHSSHGIRGSGLVVSHNVVRGNGSSGVTCFGPCVVEANVSRSNDSFGIRAIMGRVVRNVVRENADTGLELESAGYSGNTISGSGGANVSGGLNLGANSCDGALCP